MHGTDTIHPHALVQQNQVTTTTNVSEIVNEFATGNLSKPTCEINTISGSFSVQDTDDVNSVMVQLSDGSFQVFPNAN